MNDIIDLLQARASEASSLPLLVWEPFAGHSCSWSRGEFLDAVQDTAGGLAARGVVAGDRVLLHSDNCPEFLLVWFACAWLGAVCVILNPKCSSDELAYCAARTGAVGIVTQAGLAARPVSSDDSQLRWIVSIDPSGLAARPVSSDDSQLRWIVSIDPSDSLDGFDQLANEPAVPRARLDATADGCMLFTSGTTSRPKAVVWSRANALWAAQSVCRNAGLLRSDRMLVFLPLYHVAGLAWSVLPALQAGAVIILQPRFSASRFWPVAVAQCATVATHVQFSSAVLARQPVPAQHSFRLWCNSTWLPQYEAHFRIPIIGWWGMTELVAPAIMGQPDRLQQAGSIGRAAPSYDLRMADQSAFIAPGQTGAIEVKGVLGKTIFSGYLDDTLATAAAFTPDGWFRTGDCLKVHEDGSIQFLLRERDVIKTGGEGVSPAEIERVIGELPDVAEVSVVGRPDATLGEIGVAFVVPSASVGDRATLVQRIDAHCRSKLASFKVPREICLIDALPLVGINKVAKAELRRLAALKSPLPPSAHV